MNKDARDIQLLEALNDTGKFNEMVDTILGEGKFTAAGVPQMLKMHLPKHMINLLTGSAVIHPIKSIIPDNMPKG